MTEKLSKIYAKLDYVKKLDRHKEIFGANVHKYRNTKVSETELLVFEKRIGVSLPDDFREFIINIGTGAGPDFGIYTLSQMLEEYDEWAYCLGNNSKLSNTCELTNIDALDVIEQKRKNPTNFFSKRLKTANGILPIQTEGCTYCCAIILSGEQAGKMWGVDTNEFDSLPAGLITEFDFLSWYNAWLDKSISKLNESLNIDGDPKNGNQIKNGLFRNWWEKLFK